MGIDEYINKYPSKSTVQEKDNCSQSDEGIGVAWSQI